jgi:hypothetical protein
MDCVNEGRGNLVANALCILLATRLPRRSTALCRAAPRNDKGKATVSSHLAYLTPEA